MMNVPELSILIPAYNYPEGIDRIFYNSDLINYLSKIEILIFDNSTTNDVEDLVKKFILNNSNFKKNIIYKRFHNLSPIENWNKLIKNSSGDFYILIHHDEFFYDKNFFKNLFFSNYKKFDLITFKCKIIKNKLVNNHFPNRISKFLISKPYSILNINYLGPTGVLCVKKSKKCYFDTNLKWLVDIECYFRIIQKCDSIFFHNNSIGSISDYSGSITKSIKKEINTLKISERIYISNKHIEIKFYKFNLVVLLIIKNIYNILTKKFI
jgi:hypothetical protein